MIHKITYQKRLKLLLWGLFLIILLCYLVAFRKTAEEKNVLTENRKLALRVSNAGEIRENLLNELSKFESDINTEQTEGINKQEKLLEIVNRNFTGEDIRIIEIPKQERSEEAGFIVNNQIIVVQGEFEELLLFVRALEEDKGIGHICSADFYRYTDKKSGFSSTRLKLFLQDLKPRGNEK